MTMMKTLVIQDIGTPLLETYKQMTRKVTQKERRKQRKRRTKRKTKGKNQQKKKTSEGGMFNKAKDYVKSFF